MEAGTTPTTGSKTIADLLPRAAELYGDKAAVRHKVGDEWVDVTFAEVGEIVSEIGARADRPRASRRASASRCSSDTRPEWTYCSFAISAAGGVVVPIYPTNSPGGVRVGRRQLRVRRGHLRGRRRRSRRSPQVRDEPAEPAHHRRDRRRRRRRRRDPARGRARRAAAASTPRSSRSAREAVEPEDPYTFIYTSGTTGPPKGCVLLARQLPRDRSTCVDERGLLDRRRRPRLPVPAARPRLRAADPARVVRHRHDASPTSAATPSRSSPS